MLFFIARETLQSYVEFRYHGALVDETSVRKVNCRDPSKIKIPARAFGFSFFDRQEYVTANGEVLVGQPRNYSATYFLGKEMTLRQAAKELANDEKKTRLLEDMKRQGKNRIIMAKDRTIWYPGKKDIALVER